MNKINKINVCCQKVLPLVYDESLSYYEVLCKVIQKLNELIKINNNIRDEIHKEYVEILESTKTVTEAVASVTAMRDEVLSLKQATEQYANDVVTVYNETVQARDTAIAKANIAEQSATTATEKANIAQTSANTATEKAEIAEQSANTATKKANSASQSATVATTKANEAQTSANNAKQYADEAKESASLVGKDVIQLKQDVSNLQSTVGKNTSSISSLTTKVDNNTSDISSLTTKTDNNTSDISSLTTKADNNTSQITALHNTLLVYWKTLYPVGSIYISTSPTFNPNITWGGTWKKTSEGRCLIGANDTYPLGSIGGEAEHTLSISEMPSHDHNLSDWAMSWKLNGEKGEVNLNASATSDAWSNNHGYFKSQNSEATGGNRPHNNMQPYLAVYIWERTA
jgi:hypothetical protein